MRFPRPIKTIKDKIARFSELEDWQLEAMIENRRVFCDRFRDPIDRFARRKDEMNERSPRYEHGIFAKEIGPNLCSNELFDTMSEGFRPEVGYIPTWLEYQIAMVILSDREDRRAEVYNRIQPLH